MVNVDDRPTPVILWRSKDTPARMASIPNRTASVVPMGLGFTGMAHRHQSTFPARHEIDASCQGAPHHPQKRFSGGLASRHSGHGIWSDIWSPSRPSFIPLYTSLRTHPTSPPIFESVQRSTYLYHRALP
jgi:hypothetical protein